MPGKTPRKHPPSFPLRRGFMLDPWAWTRKHPAPPGTGRGRLGFRGLRKRYCRRLRDRRFFHNLRASRETELAAVHPVHMVAEWLGLSDAEQQAVLAIVRRLSKKLPLIRFLLTAPHGNHVSFAITDKSQVTCGLPARAEWQYRGGKHMPALLSCHWSTRDPLNQAVRAVKLPVRRITSCLSR